MTDRVIICSLVPGLKKGLDHGRVSLEAVQSPFANISIAKQRDNFAENIWFGKCAADRAAIKCGAM